MSSLTSGGRQEAEKHLDDVRPGPYNGPATPKRLCANRVFLNSAYYIYLSKKAARKWERGFPVEKKAKKSKKTGRVSVAMFSFTCYNINIQNKKLRNGVYYEIRT